MTPYEQLVIELTNRSFSHQAAYRSGGTPYDLSAREPDSYDQQIKTFARMVEEADCVLVGGASGLSAAGGGDFYYEDNATYRRHFGKFAERYGFKGAFEGSFYRWPTAETRWGYLATFLDTTLNAPLREPYKDLDAVLAEKNFFVLTTNQDTQFVKIYPWEKVAEIQGDHRFFQCSRCCTDEVWDATGLVSRMIEAMGAGLEVPPQLVPRCPHCGAEAFPWVRGYGNFLQGELYEEQYRKVSDWLDAHAEQKILFLELGVGLRNGVIKHMLAQIANACEHTTYTVLNYSQTMALDASCETILVDGDMAPAFAREPRAIRALCARAQR